MLYSFFNFLCRLILSHLMTDNAVFIIKRIVRTSSGVTAHEAAHFILVKAHSARIALRVLIVDEIRAALAVICH